MRSQHQRPTGAVQRSHMPLNILLWSCVLFHVQEMGGLYTKMDKHQMEMQKIMIQLSKQSKGLSKKAFNLQMNSDKKEHKTWTLMIYKISYENYVCYLDFQK